MSGSGAAGTSTIGTIAHAYGDTTTTGTGSGFVTYQADGNGVRPLAAGEYSSNAYALNSNVNVSSAGTSLSGGTINSFF